MIGKTNCGNGSGSSFNGALIHVKATVGSTITFLKDNIIVKVLEPKKSHINIDDNTMADQYYAINNNNYGMWTVTATKGDTSTSKNVTVDSNKQYDVALYPNRLYWDGDECTDITGGWNNLNITTNNYTHANLSITKNASNIYAIASTTSTTFGAVGIGKSVDMTDYSTLKINVTSVGVSGFKPNFHATTGTSGNIWSINAGYTNLYDNGTGVSSVDVSSLKGNYYVVITCGNYNSNRGYVTFTRVWLE